MNLNLLSLLPCTVCFVFAVLTTAGMMKKQIDYTTLTFLILLLLASVYFYIDANMVINTTNYRTLVILDIIDNFVCLSLLPLSFIFVTRYVIGADSVNVWRAALFFVPALVVGSVGTFIYLYGGIDEMAQFLQAYDATGTMPAGYEHSIFHAQQVVCNFIFTLLLLIQMIMFLTFCFFNIKRSRICVYFVSFVLICGLRVVLGRTFLINHPNISCILSIAICACAAAIFAYKSYRDEKRMVARIKQYYEEVYVSDNASALETPQNNSNVLDIQRHVELTMEQVSQEDKAEQSFEMDQASQLRLAAEIRHYIVEDQHFLDPQINIEKMAEDLKTNHTYISIVMRYMLGSNFRTFINKYRIDFAKKLMTSQPDLLLEDVADQSGFTSSAQFVKKFKEVEGVPPRRWQHGAV